MTWSALHFGLMTLILHCGVLIRCSSGANILISLTNAMSTKSHSYSLARIAEGLIEKGHYVTVLAASNKGTMGFRKSSYNDSIIYPIPYTREETDALQDSFTRVSFRKQSILDYAEVLPVAQEFFGVVAAGCKSLFAQPSHLQRLRNRSFHAIIGIPFCPCDALLAEYLNISFIAFTATFRYETFNEELLGIPTPNAYVPFPLYEALTDEMTFLQRLYNLFYRFAFVKYLTYVWSKPFVALQMEHNISTKLTIREILGKTQLWLAHTNFALDFPRPTAPAWVPVGGLLAKPSDPLQQDLNEFIQGAGNHGVIVFSLGSMVTSLMREDLNELFAEVFSDLPQRVIWRFVGPPPRKLGNNTRLMEWLPQNDLLGHPQTRLLIYHGGINGVYEAIYHKVPMVLLPIFADQPAIGARVSKKGMGVVLDRATLTYATVKGAIEEVIHDTKYKVNVEHYGAIHHHSLASPLDTAIFWIEHVLKFGGSHLRLRGSDLSFIVLNSVDVVAFMIVVLVVAIYINYLVLRTCCRLCCTKKKSKLKAE